MRIHRTNTKETPQSMLYNSGIYKSTFKNWQPLEPPPPPPPCTQRCTHLTPLLSVPVSSKSARNQAGRLAQTNTPDQNKCSVTSGDTCKTTAISTLTERLRRRSGWVPARHGECRARSDIIDSYIYRYSYVIYNRIKRKSAQQCGASV